MLVIPTYYSGSVEVARLLWDEHNIAHIARHGVTRGEVDEVVFSPATRWAPEDRHRRGRLVAFGATGVGRLLVVVCDTPTVDGSSYPVTARPMDDRERRDFERGQDDAQDQD